MAVTSPSDPFMTPCFSGTCGALAAGFPSLTTPRHATPSSPTLLLRQRRRIGRLVRETLLNAHRSARMFAADREVEPPLPLRAGRGAGDGGGAWQRSGDQMTERLKEDRRLSAHWPSSALWEENIFYRETTNRSLLYPAIRIPWRRCDQWVVVAPSSIDPLFLFQRCRADRCVWYSAVFLTLSYYAHAVVWMCHYAKGPVIILTPQLQHTCTT